MPDANLIYLNNYKVQNTTTQFIRPIPVQIKDTEFISAVPEKKKHAADPIKNPEDIFRIINYFISTGDYRDNLLFVMGINFGLRCGDLLRMKFGDIIKSQNEFKQEVRIEEEKTDKVDAKTGEKTKRGNIRTCYMNDAVMDAAVLYFSSLDSPIDLNEYLFTSLSNNRSQCYYDSYSYKDTNAPITTYSVERMLKRVINDKLGIDVHAGTHLMRKTFAYNVLVNAPDRNRALEFLQYALGHKSQASTLHYIGITDDEMRMTCQNLNIGAEALAMSKNICYAAGLSNAV